MLLDDYTKLYREPWLIFSSSLLKSVLHTYWSLLYLLKSKPYLLLIYNITGEILTNTNDYSDL